MTVGAGRHARSILNAGSVPHRPRPSRVALRSFSVICVALLVATTVLPSVLAAHGSEVPLTPGTTATLEDDGAIVNAPGHVFHGRENRVVPAGRTMGDGSLFLDARLHESVSGIVAGAEVPLGLIVGGALGRPNLVFPGEQQVDAWYGWWNDLNDDGVIDDVHDGVCGASSCPEDEFKWRGIASGEALTMTVSYIPGNTSISGAPDVAYHSWARMKDETIKSGAHQTWTSNVRTAYSESLISTKTVVAYTNAREVTGSYGRYPFDLTDGNALVDVDVHDALSPDVESLWWASLIAVKQIDEASRDPVSLLPANPYPVRPPPVDAPARPELPVSPTALLTFAVGTTLAVYNGEPIGYPARPPSIEPLPLPPMPGPSVTSIMAEVAGQGSRILNLFPLDNPTAGGFDLLATITRLITPPWPKEPNTSEDDYGQNALYGGVGDSFGSYNTYGPYADSRHLWIDNRAHMRTCYGAEGQAPLNVITLNLRGGCVQSPYEPVGGTGRGVRSSGVALGFEMNVELWHDLNGDTHVGTYCDPSGPEFDADRNTCAAYSAWAHAPSGREVIHACTGSSARNGRIILTPLDGPWPDVIVVRDGAEFSPLAPGAAEIRSDSSPIELAWATECDLSSNVDTGKIDSRDQVYFPKGPTVAIRVITEVVSATYSDPDTGAIHPPERVVDVDILPAGM